MSRFFKLSFLIIIGFSIMACGSGAEESSGNAKPAQPKVEKKQEPFKLFELRKYLSRCDHLELVYYTPQGTITTENTSQGEIMRFATYIAEGGSPSANCASEGLVIFRGKGEIVVEMDYAIKECSYMQIKMGGKTYKQYLNEEGEHFFSQFSKFQ